MYAVGANSIFKGKREWVKRLLEKEAERIWAGYMENFWSYRAHKDVKCDNSRQICHFVQ